MDDIYHIAKLTRRKFTDALQKGLGRAYLHANKFGIDEVADLVLKACLHDQACDPQSERSKAEYLFGIFRNTPYLSKFRDTILNALRIKRNTWDVELLFEIALQMAKEGDAQSRISIRDRALKEASMYWQASKGQLNLHKYMVPGYLKILVILFQKTRYFQTRSLKRNIAKCL